MFRWMPYLFYCFHYFGCAFWEAPHSCISCIPASQPDDYLHVCLVVHWLHSVSSYLPQSSEKIDGLYLKFRIFFNPHLVTYIPHKDVLWCCFPVKGYFIFWCLNGRHICFIVSIYLGCAVWEAPYSCILYARMPTRWLLAHVPCSPLITFFMILALDIIIYFNAKRRI